MDRVTYSVKAIFDTVQGEGARAGTRAVFVRFAGCNLWDGRPEGRGKGRGACARWCDTDFAHGDKLTAADILAKMDALWPLDKDNRWCVVTGGEPALQFDGDLLLILHRAGWKVAMETNGTVDSDAVRAVDWLTVSPKKGGAVIVRGGSELKVILPGATNGEVGWTDAELLELGRSRLWEHRFVQPMDPPISSAVEDTYLHPATGLTGDVDAYRQSLEQCLTFVRVNPHWRLGAQLHKYWQLP